MPKKKTPMLCFSILDLHVLLLEDLLVLLQRQDEKLVLKCHSKMALGSSDTKQTFSPILKLNSVLIRSVATGSDDPGIPVQALLSHMIPGQVKVVNTEVG